MTWTCSLLTSCVARSRCCGGHRGHYQGLRRYNVRVFSESLPGHDATLGAEPASATFNPPKKSQDLRSGPSPSFCLHATAATPCMQQEKASGLVSSTTWLARRIHPLLLVPGLWRQLVSVAYLRSCTATHIAHGGEPAQISVDSAPLAAAAWGPKSGKGWFVGLRPEKPA